MFIDRHIDFFFLKKQCYVVIKRKEFLIFAKTGKNLEHIVLSTIKPGHKGQIFCDSTSVGYLKGKSIEKKVEVWGGGIGDLLLNGYRVSVWSNEKFLEIVVMVAQHCVRT